MDYIGYGIGFIIGGYLIIKGILKYFFVVICLPVLIPIALYMAPGYRFWDVEMQRKRLYIPAAWDALINLVVMHLHLIIGLGFLVFISIIVMLYG